MLNQYVYETLWNAVDYRIFTISTDDRRISEPSTAVEKKKLTWKVHCLYSEVMKYDTIRQTSCIIFQEIPNKNTLDLHPFFDSHPKKKGVIKKCSLKKVNAKKKTKTSGKTCTKHEVNFIKLHEWRLSPSPSPKKKTTWIAPTPWANATWFTNRDFP